MEKFQLFKDTYNLCAQQPGRYISDYFKKFIDKLLPEKFIQNPLRKAMLTGYFLRSTETIMNQRQLKEPDTEIKNILNNKRNDFEKIEELANYLDNHDKIGLSEKSLSYSLISSENTQYIFTIYAENFITHTLEKGEISKDKVETFYEIAYRNIAFGYLYKLSEEFIEKAEAVAEIL